MDRSAPSKAKVAAARVCLSALKASETPTALNSGRSERLSPIAMQFEASTPKHSHCCLMNVTLVCSSAYAAVLPINTPSLTASSGPHHASNPNLCARLSETTVQAQDARTGLIPLDLHSATDCAFLAQAGDRSTIREFHLPDGQCIHEHQYRIPCHFRSHRVRIDPLHLASCRRYPTGPQ